MSLIEIITICIVFLILFLPFIFDYIKYKKSAYYKITKNSYGLLLTDKGLRGEYSIYKKLKNLEDTGAKFLFNLYIPTYKNKTTEIDIIMICNCGVFVFESKNYSGWIFGSRKFWTQSLHVGYGITQKEHFYNPIWQNETHIKYLKKIIGEEYPIHSIVVFSSRCELKNINTNYSETIVTNDYYLNNVVNNIFENPCPRLLTNYEINQLYLKLYEYSQVTDDIKCQHVRDMIR